jgi:hypothetical protein
MNNYEELVTKASTVDSYTAHAPPPSVLSGQYPWLFQYM